MSVPFRSSVGGSGNQGNDMTPFTAGLIIVFVLADVVAAADGGWT